MKSLFLNTAFFGLFFNLTIASAADRIQPYNPESFDQCGEAVPEAFRKLFFNLAESDDANALFKSFAIYEAEWEKSESQLSAVSLGGVTLMSAGGLSFWLAGKSTPNGASQKSLTVLGFATQILGAGSILVARTSKDVGSLSQSTDVEIAKKDYVRRSLMPSDIEDSSEAIMKHWAPALQDLNPGEQLGLKTKIGNAITMAAASYTDTRSAADAFTQEVTDNVKKLLTNALGERKVAVFLALQEAELAERQKLGANERAWLENKNNLQCSPETIELYLNQLKKLITFTQEKIKNSPDAYQNPKLSESLWHAIDTYEGAVKLQQNFIKYKKAHTLEASE